MLNPFPGEALVSQPSQPQNWVALSIGNTHWKWGYFEGAKLTQTWATSAQAWEAQTSQESWDEWCLRSPAFQWHQDHNQTPFPFLRLASVVQTEQQQWLTYPNLQVISLTNIPLVGLYEGMGIDRALAVLGAGQNYGWPVLVIDAGTALTFSGADQCGFEGGAIAPGLGLQLSMLHHNTAALPQVKLTPQMPEVWAKDTQNAIFSGVVLGALATIQSFTRDWIKTRPHSSILITGGDGALLTQLLTQFRDQSISINYQYDATLIFQGLAHC